VKRLFLPLIATAFAAALLQSAHLSANAQTSATPPPPPPAPNATPAQILTLPTAKPKGAATPAPPKDVDANRVGISGVWEIAIQQPNGQVQYTHFKLAQNGSVLSGQYLDSSGKKYPISGSIDGKQVRVVVSMPNGTAMVFNGAQDGGTDMVGTIDTASDLVGFTAEYRPKYKWIDNLSPSPTGGVGGGTPGVP